MNGYIKLTLAVLSMTFVAGGCERSTENDSTGKNRGSSDMPAAGTPADNTARNKTDRDMGTKTPMDQSNGSADIKITAEIRRAIMDDKAMSMNAQNCKIITDNAGIVTLRGPVASQAEKDSIEAKAKAVAGVNRVVNELEVKTN